MELTIFPKKIRIMKISIIYAKCLIKYIKNDQRSCVRQNGIRLTVATPFNLKFSKSSKHTQNKLQIFIEKPLENKN